MNVGFSNVKSEYRKEPLPPLEQSRNQLDFFIIRLYLNAQFGGIVNVQLSIMCFLFSQFALALSTTRSISNKTKWLNRGHLTIALPFGIDISTKNNKRVSILHRNSVEFRWGVDECLLFSILPIDQTFNYCNPFGLNCFLIHSKTIFDFFCQDQGLPVFVYIRGCDCSISILFEHFIF